MTTLRNLITRSGVSEILRGGRSCGGSWGQFRAFAANDASSPNASAADSVEDVGVDDADAEDVTGDDAASPEPDASEAGQSGSTGARRTGIPAKRREDEYFGGLFKATLLGRVVHAPVQKVLKSGRAITIFSLGTGGMRNMRRPFEGESVEEFADRSSVQWHKVAVYNENLGAAAMRWIKAGSQVFVEGNLETRMYNDPSTGLVKRIKEVAVRQSGKVLFMDGADQSKSRLPRAFQKSAAPTKRNSGADEE